MPDTGTHKTVQLASDTISRGRVDPDVPIPRPDTPSVAHALSVLTAAAIGDRLPQSSRDDLTRGIGELLASIETMASERLAAESEAAPTARRAAPWIILASVSTTLLVGTLALAMTWLVSLDGRQAEAEEYQRGLAQYLVLKSSSDGRTDASTDKMLRRLAGAQGIDVSDIPQPDEIEPPNAVKRRALESEE